IRLEDLLNPDDDDRTEFFDNVNILINDANSRNELICENTRQVLTDTLELSKGNSD
ncbi:4950_t:CDS:2, partial [Dentiscutata erythropus]